METRICKFCGKEFIPVNGKQLYCKREHYGTCIICGKQFLIPNDRLCQKDKASCCSKECSAELRKRTCRKIYGGNAPASSKEVIAKMENTTLQRYGVKHAGQSEIFKEKTRQTNLEKYGKEYYYQTDEGKQKLHERWENWKENDPERYNDIVEKIKNTNMEKYGVTSTLHAPEIKEKYLQEYKEKTGYDYPSQNPKYRTKVEQTNLERYGVRRPLQNKKIYEKAVNTNLKKYGQTAFNKTYEYRSMALQDKSKLDEFIEFDSDTENFLKNRFDHKPNLREIADYLTISIWYANQIIHKSHCENLISRSYSNMEYDVTEELKNINPDIQIELHNREIINPYEIDLYLPEYKIGIECNSTIHHNSSISIYNGEDIAVESNYHQMKTDLCEQKGIFLFHIFSYEWEHKREIIISMLRNLLGKNKNKLYARKLELREISNEESLKFLEENHRQGKISCRYRIGLYNSNELVSLMTFSKARFKENNSWELVRFCNLKNTTVVGGASKLFQKFIKDVNPYNIISYSDRAHTKGNLYKILGFEEYSRSKPGYVWVDINTDTAYNRINAQKKNIRKFLNDDTIDLSQTEVQIMESHGYVKVYDSGVITWKWQKG